MGKKQRRTVFSGVRGLIVRNNTVEEFHELAEQKTWIGAGP